MPDALLFADDLNSGWARTARDFDSQQPGLGKALRELESKLWTEPAPCSAARGHDRPDDKKTAEMISKRMSKFHMVGTSSAVRLTVFATAPLSADVPFCLAGGHEYLYP